MEPVVVLVEPKDPKNLLPDYGPEPLHEAKYYFEKVLLWPNVNRSRAVQLLALFPIFFPFHFPILMYLYMGFESVEEHLGAMTEFFAGVIFYGKALTFIYFNEQIGELMTVLDKAWAKNRLEGNQARRRQLLVGDQQNVKLNRYFLYGFLIAGFNYCGSPVLSYLIQKYVLGWNPQFHFGAHNYIVNYTAVHGGLFYSLSVCLPSVMYFVYIFGLYNGILPAIMNTVAELFVQIHMRLNDLNERFDELSEKEICEEFKDIMKDHRVAIDSAKRFEAVASRIFLIQNMVIAILNVILAFLLSLMVFDFVIITGKIGFTFVMWLDLYMCCAYGDKILQKSTELATTAYFMDWYRKGREVRRFTLFIIQRSHRSVGFTVGRFYYVSLDRFAQVARSSVSYLTLMRSLFA